jgi:tRNA-dihydrouridine synthase 3
VEADSKPPVVPTVTPEPNSTVDNIVETRTGELSAPLSQVDTPDVLVRFREKKKLHWTGKTCASN